MAITINPDLLRSAIRGLEQDQLNRKDRAAIIRLLRELAEATEKSPRIEGDPQTVIQVTLQGSAERERQQVLDEQIAIQERRQRESAAAPSDGLTHDLSAVLDTLFDEVEGLFDSYIFLYEAGRLAFGAGRAATSREDLPWRSPRPRGLTYTVARLGQVMIIPDMSTHPLFADLHWSGSIIGLPLRLGPRIVGVLTVCRRPPGDFSETELPRIQILADQAALAIENARIARLAGEQVLIDPATGLHNRHALQERLDTEVIQSTDSQVPFALFMLNLDGYEEINERYGHSAGDFLLVETATAIAKDLRKTDFLARYDAARYCLVLSRTDRSTAESIAERIQDIIGRRRFNLPEKGARKVSLSIGASVFPQDGLSSGTIIDAAAAALAASSEAGSIGFASQPAARSSPHPAP